MYKIYIDTAERYIKSIKLTALNNGIEELLDQVKGDIQIVPEIQRLLNKHAINIEEVIEVVPNKGPGSFTGLKIGVTVANVLNWALNNKELDDLVLPNYGNEPNIHKK